jgi:23S rRNA pseudouridine2605 synthase
VAFNKPKNVLSTDEPHENDTRRTVREFIPIEGHLVNVGRLDADSEGLMVLTNDGELANRLTHPRYQHTKTYKVVVYGLPNAETLSRWQAGIVVEDDETGESYKTAPCSVTVVDGGKETTLRIIMTEGKKRQIRRVATALGYPVKSLLRTHIGKLALGTLRPGEWRELTAKDLEALKTPADEMRASRPHPARSSRPARPSVPARGRPPKTERTGRTGRSPTPRRPNRNNRRGDR